MINFKNRLILPWVVSWENSEVEWNLIVPKHFMIAFMKVLYPYIRCDSPFLFKKVSNFWLVTLLIHRLNLCYGFLLGFRGAPSVNETVNRVYGSAFFKDFSGGWDHSLTWQIFTWAFVILVGWRVHLENKIIVK